MIEVRNLRIPLPRLGTTRESELEQVRACAARALRTRPQAISSLELRRRSVDARRRDAIALTYTVRVEVKNEQHVLAALRRRHQDRDVRPVSEPRAARPRRAPVPRTGLVGRPVVVGAGCAGLFCALTLAEAGLEPLLVERGADATRRTAQIGRFVETGELDPETNVQFGLGGAGTFSDGKLSTGTRSPAHRRVLEALVEAGAQPEILWDAKPHVGSDVLPGVVANVAARIQELGGEVWCDTRLVDLDLAGGRVRGVTLSRRSPATGATSELRLSASHVVLSCGHSARDVFELLHRRGVALERKTFAMGVRIEHLQADVDRALYGDAAGNPLLGPAPYKLVAHLPGGRSAFSFCMCPGGYVVAAASEPGGVVTNGMSLSDRGGTNANAALLANVFPEDLPGSDVLAGVELQRACERTAFEAGGGDFRAPAQLMGDFLQGVPSSSGAGITPTYPRGVTWGDAGQCLPPYVREVLREALPLLDRRLRGFARADAVLTGVETRSSSPVRVPRGADGQSVGVRGLWPAGEGAGYAGGIMSAATDGIRAAEHLIEDLTAPAA